MKVAITVWGKRISPVFDVARTLLVFEILDQGRQASAERVCFPADADQEMVIQFLVKAGIDTLICGAISRQPAERLEAQGITLIPFIAGAVDQVVEGFTSGSSITRYCMPGCPSGVRRKNRRCCRRGSPDSPGETPELQ